MSGMHLERYSEHFSGTCLGRRNAAFFATLTACLLIAVTCVSAHASPRMGSRAHGDIMLLINRGKEANPLPGGWEIRGFTFSEINIDVLLEGASGARALVRLSYDGFEPTGETIGFSHSFCVEILDASGKGSRQAAHAFFKRIQANDTSYFFNSENMLRRESATLHFLRKHIMVPLAGKVHPAIMALVVLIPLVALLSSGPAQRILLPSTRLATLILLCIFAATLLLRFYVSPEAPVHCNTHGIREIRSYLYGQYPMHGKPVVWYGNTFPTTMRWLLTFMGASENKLFRVNEVLGALAVVSFFLLLKGLHLSDTAALAGAAFMGLSPSQVWLSGTESQMPMMIFTGLFGMALLCVAGRERSPTFYWVGMAFITFAACLRIISILLVPAAALVFLYAATCGGAQWKRDFMLQCAAGFLVAVVMAAMHYLSISRMTDKGWSEIGLLRMAGAFLSEKNILADPTLTPVILPLMALAALILGRHAKPRFLLLVVSLSLLLWPLTFTLLDCRTSVLRYQAPHHWVMFLAAASLFSEFMPEWVQRRKNTLIIICTAMFILNAGYGLAMLQKGDEEVHEYRFMTRIAQSLEKETIIRLPVVNAAQGKLHTDFPDYVNDLLVVKGNSPASEGHQEILYLGLDCYRYEDEFEIASGFTADGYSLECANACSGRLEPLEEITLNARTPRLGFQHRFYRLTTKEPTVGFYHCIPEPEHSPER